MSFRGHHWQIIQGPKWIQTKKGLPEILRIWNWQSFSFPVLYIIHVTQSNGSSKNENTVILYSPSCHSKHVWLTFFWDILICSWAVNINGVQFCLEICSCFLQKMTGQPEFTYVSVCVISISAVDKNNNSTFTFSHLADTFHPKQLTNEDNGSNQNQQKSNDMNVSVSITQYT